MNNQVNAIQEIDEINLSELWKTLVKRKRTITITTLLITIATAIYVLTATPIYRGNVLIEVGEVMNDFQYSNTTQSPTVVALDNINNLKEIIMATIQNGKMNIIVPDGTTNLLKISIEGQNNAEIKLALDTVVEFILNRHQEKSKFYQNDGMKIRMTHIVGEIQIGNDPISPKKGLLIAVALITGLVLGVFLAFFKELITSRDEILKAAQVE